MVQCWYSCHSDNYLDKWWWYLQWPLSFLFLFILSLSVSSFPLPLSSQKTAFLPQEQQFNTFVANGEKSEHALKEELILDLCCPAGDCGDASCWRLSWWWWSLSQWGWSSSSCRQQCVQGGGTPPQVVISAVPHRRGSLMEMIITRDGSFDHWRPNSPQIPSRNTHWTISWKDESSTAVE